MPTPSPTEPVEKSTVFAVLGARRIGLRAAKRAKPLQLLAALVPEQVLDGVEDRRGVRLDRDAVLRTQHVEIERGHQGRQRGARRLVAADLQPVAVRRAGGWRCGSSRSTATAPCARAPSGRRYCPVPLILLGGSSAFQGLQHILLLLQPRSLSDMCLRDKSFSQSRC